MVWFADIDNEIDGVYRWQPVLADDTDNHVIFSAPTYMRTKEECEKWIREVVIPNAKTLEL